jgi:dihydrofolate reductase
MISLIAAIGSNRELGKDNKLLWHIGEDLKRFKKLTEGHVVIMGRKTFESIGKPLTGRLNIIITRNPDYKVDNYNVSKHCKVIVVNSLEQAIEKSIKSKVHKVLKVEKDEVFIIGGGQIYEEAIEIADKLYLTIVDVKAEADTFFPDYSGFKKIVFDEPHDNGGYKFRFVELIK